MAELAPGLYVSSWMPGGIAYVLDEALMGLGSGVGGTGRSIALAEADWERIAPARREELLDLYVRRSAEWGTDELQRWLAAEMARSKLTPLASDDGTDRAMGEQA